MVKVSQLDIILKYFSRGYITKYIYFGERQTHRLFQSYKSYLFNIESIANKIHGTFILKIVRGLKDIKNTITKGMKQRNIW